MQCLRKLVQGETTHGPGSGRARQTALLQQVRVLIERSRMEGVPPHEEQRTPEEEQEQQVVARSPLAQISEEELEMLLAPDNDLLCAITGELFEDPVVTDDGHTYERTAIEEWFHSQKLAGRPVTSPKTNVKLKNTRVVQNNKVKSDVIKWCEDLAKRAKELADEYPGSAIDLLERALEYHPDNAETWLQLACAHEDQATEGWCASAFRCRFNHSQAKDTEEDYKSFLEWCERTDQLAEFEAAVLRIAEPKCPALPHLLAAALERTGGEELGYEDAPRRAQRNSTDHDASIKKAYQPRDEMPGQQIYSCKIKRVPPSIDYATKREQPALLCVSSEGVTVIDAVAKLQSPIICRYTFHQILSWTVAKDTFSFHVLLRVNGANQKEAFEFTTPEGKAISLKLKEHVNVLLQERTRERRLRARPRKAPAAAAAAAVVGASEEASLASVVLDEYYGVPSPDEDDACTRLRTETSGVAPRSLVTNTSATSTTRAPSHVQEDRSSDQDHRSGETPWSTTSIMPPRPTSPPAVASDAVNAPNTVDPRQVRELALVFPQEADAELKRVLLASGGDFEAAARALLDKPIQVRTGRFRQSGWGAGLADAVRGSGVQPDLGRISSSSSANVDIIEGAMAIMSAAMVPCPPTVREQSAFTSRAAGAAGRDRSSRSAADVQRAPPVGRSTTAAPPVDIPRLSTAAPASGRRQAGANESRNSRSASGFVQTASTTSPAESITEMGLASEPPSPADSESSLMEQLVALPVPSGTVSSTAAGGGRKSTGARGRRHETQLRGAVGAAVSMPMPAE